MVNPLNWFLIGLVSGVAKDFPPFSSKGADSLSNCSHLAAELRETGGFYLSYIEFIVSKKLDTSDGALTELTVKSPSIRLTNPVRTFPAPISITWVIP